MCLVFSSTWSPATPLSPSLLPPSSPISAGFESHNVAVNPDKTKLSFALQLAAEGGRASGQPPATMPATVWRSGELPPLVLAVPSPPPSTLQQKRLALYQSYCG